MATTARPITFVVPGYTDTVTEPAGRGATAARSRGRITQSVRVASRRAGGGAVRVEATPGKDIVVLQIADGPELFLHPENARDLFAAQSGASGRSRSGAPAADNVVVVPVQLQWSGAPPARAARGIGDVALAALHVMTDVAEDGAADFVASEVVRRVDQQVDAGVYALNPQTLATLKGQQQVTGFPSAGDASPFLVLIHGTFSSTSGTFSKLWMNHPEHVRALFKRYDNRVFALDHPTLGVSPVANALTLAEALPDRTRLHLLTHSRGGLVGETMARICADPAGDFTEFAGKQYLDQRSQLRKLGRIVKKKDIRVARVVRVACPARGTLLASKRVDAYLSVFKWTLELAGIPVAPELLDFIKAVAKRRADPLLMPGLAAQVPDSPLIRWLHGVGRRIDGDLRVIAGDLQGDSVCSWVKTLLTDAFYWTDHDLVVQTRSMYGGAPREAASTFVLDQGGQVTHFNYFSNNRTAQAITNALVQDTPQDFSVIGPLSWAGESSTGTRARISRSAASAASRPAVFLLPGMVGSNLKIGSDRIWVSWRLVNGLAPLALAASKRDKVEPDGFVGSGYDNLTAFLSSTHAVIPFPFDWRRPMEEEARRLAKEVSAALDARVKSGKPVRILAHSMGGLLARTMQLEAPKIWSRMLSHEGARVVMLGVPNGGSFAPMQVLSGDDTFGGLLSLVGEPFQGLATRTALAGFPGFMQLQAGLLGDMRLSSARTWQSLAEKDLERATASSTWHRLPLQLESLQWGIPSQKALDGAVALRRRLDTQAKNLEVYRDRLLCVVGQAPFTAERFEMKESGLVYSGSADGDGRVPLDSALLPGVAAWRVPCTHEQLPNRKEVFAAYLELLDKGTTSLIETAPDTRPQPGSTPVTTIEQRPSRAGQKSIPPRTQDQALAVSAVGETDDVPAIGPPLRISVYNGDLTFIRQPLMLGHYRSLRLTGTENVMNRRIGNAMEQSLHLGTYPDAVGSNRIFINRQADPENPWQLPRPAAVIVVGLGPEATLRATDLVHAARQGALAWAERQAERAGTDADFELAATLIGSGGPGISAGQSAQLLAQGVAEANERLAQEQRPASEGDDTSRASGQLTRLHLVELYLDRATEALRALHLQSDAYPGRYEVDPVIQPGIGALERPVDSNYRGADYDFISALTRKDADGSDAIEFTLDTKRARTEVHAQRPQGALVQELVAQASNTTDDGRIGRTLFQLLVPVEIEPYLGGSTEMQIEVNSGTAGIPWELVDTDREGFTGRNEREPWAIRAKLLRKLRVDNPPQRPDADADGSALVIGEPKCDPEKYPPLAGARTEARQVAECLASASGLGSARVESLIRPDDPSLFGPDSLQVLNVLFDTRRVWRIVHIAGHGEPAVGADGGGVVLSTGFLSAKEIKSMRVIPELVFVNCCYLAARDPAQLLAAGYDRARFAAGVAEELITVGVRCVIAAGWAVDDEAASAFATTFYRSLLGGQRFLDAVSDARKAAFQLGGNTWAAYQCYGDPDWRFKRDISGTPSPAVADQFQDVVSSAALARALTTLAVQSEFQGADREAQSDRIRYLENKARQTRPEWLGIGSVAEAFGRAWAAVREVELAIHWYEAAAAAPDGTAAVKAIEQLANWKCRVATSRTVSIPSSSTATHPSPQDEVREAIALLTELLAVHPTAERESLCGSAYKRLAMIELAGGNRDRARAALAQSQAHYAKAAAIAAQAQDNDAFYPAQNGLIIDLALNIGGPGWPGLDAGSVEALRQLLSAKAQSDPDFWSIVGPIELRMYESLAAGTLAGEHAAILRDLADLHERVPAPRMWGSVNDQLTFVMDWARPARKDAELEAAETLVRVLGEYAGVARAEVAAKEVRGRRGRGKRVHKRGNRVNGDERKRKRRK